MNPQFNYTNLTEQYVPHITVPPALSPTYQLTLQDILSGKVSDKSAADAQGFNPLSDLESKLVDNIPNFAIGGIGLFMILVGIGAVAAPAVKELA